VFGKQIHELDRSDLARLKAERTEEDQFLEFKAEVPADKRKSAPGWTPGESLQPYGRDKLMEEFAGFANAFGGEIVLGISETKEKPHRAEEISPIPSVYELADRLRDIVKDTIEPPLLRSAVHVIATGENEGVIVMGVAPSTRGPHRVKTTLKVPFRREKTCDSMSMPEIIDRARGFDRTSLQLDRAISAIVSLKMDFRDSLGRMVPTNYVGGTKEERINAWIKREGRPFVAMRAAVSAEDRLFLDSVDSFEQLTARTSLVRTDPGGVEKHLGIAYPAVNGLPVVDGVEHERFLQDGMERHVVKRDGYAEVTSIFAPEHGLAPLDWFARYLAGPIALYDALRIHAGAPTMPARILVNIGSMGLARVQISQTLSGPRPLPEDLRLPSVFFDRLDSAERAFNNVIADYANAAGIKRTDLATYRLT
jgi:hypothetical protein